MDDNEELWDLPLLDEHGNVILLDENGEEVLDENGDPVLSGTSLMQIDPVDVYSKRHGQLL